MIEIQCLFVENGTVFHPIHLFEVMMKFYLSGFVILRTFRFFVFFPRLPPLVKNYHQNNNNCKDNNTYYCVYCPMNFDITIVFVPLLT